MKKSSIPKVAKAIYKELEKSKTKDVMLYSKNDKYKVFDYEYEAPDELSDYCAVNFNYSDKDLPNIEEIEKSLYDIFIKVVQ